MEDGHLPAEWKVATVVPIYKKGDKLVPANFRPISLTSIVCRTMEKIIAERLREFLSEEHIIIDEQHGFVSKRSIVTNLLQCVNQWIKNHDNGKPTDVIYLDYEKAFDRVPVRRLIHKLEHLGIRGKLLAWISDFLTNRNFCVRVGSTLSSPRLVLSGVPQGSVLGPLLFILYLTDLKQALKIPFSLFADDTKFFGDPNSQYQEIQKGLNDIFDWTKDWLLTLNAGKCTVLHIGKKNPQKRYYLGNQQLTPVESQRDLGITITTDLKWETHIVTIVKRANSMLYLIRKSFMTLTPKTFVKLYKTYIRPLLEFAYVIWDPYFKKDITLLENVQRRATKLVKSLRNMTYERRLKELNLTTLESRRSRGRLIETYKILTGYYDVPDLQDLFQLSTNKRLRGHSLKLCRMRAKKNPLQNFLPNRVVTDWNKLPMRLINAPSVNSFKNGLDKLQKISKPQDTHASAL